MRRERNYALSSVRLRVSARLLTVQTVAVIAMSALFLSGCATRRKSVTERGEQTLTQHQSVLGRHLARDSASEVVEVRTVPMRVPKSEVSLTIATDSLRRLPVGASYSERSGQASVKVSRKAATATEPEYIYVYATCDSLQLQCERYERTIRNLHKDYGEQLNGLKIRLAESKQELQELEEKPPNPIGTALKWYLAGLVSGIIGTIIIFIKLKK